MANPRPLTQATCAQLGWHATFTTPPLGAPTLGAQAQAQLQLPLQLQLPDS